MSLPVRSVKYKMFFVIGIVSIIFMGLFAFFYLAFYDDFNLMQNKKQLLYIFNTLDEAYTGNVEENIDFLDRVNTLYDVRITIAGSDMTVYYDNSYFYKFDEVLPFFNRSDVQLHLEVSPAFQLSEDERYRYLIQVDEKSKVDTLNFLGRLNNGDYIVLKKPIPIIETNSQYTGSFLLLAGIPSFLFCLLIAYLMSRSFSKPLVRINNIAKEMAKLNFANRYSGSSYDEIGQLGESINSLSGQLESTIGKLKDTNSQLEIELEKGRQTDEMRKNLIANVSHELKTPLALIRGYAEGLKVNISSGQEDKDFYCDVILEESNRMSKIVMQLMDLAKIEIGNLKPEYEDWYLPELINRITDKQSIMLKEKGIVLLKDIPDLAVHADADMMEQVLTNLLSNAIHHTPEGGKITIGHQILDDKIRIIIFNEGQNVPPDDLEKIWLSFYKVDKARTRAYGGTGIGLAVVKAVMEAHDNDYGVSNRDNGVEFWFDIDLAHEYKPIDED